MITIPLRAMMLVMPLIFIPHAYALFNQAFNVGVAQKIKKSQPSKKRAVEAVSSYLAKQEEVHLLLRQTLDSLKEPAEQMSKLLQSEEFKQLQKQTAEKREQEEKSQSQNRERSSRGGRSGGSYSGSRSSYGGSPYSSYSSPYASRGRSSFGGYGGGGSSSGYDSGYTPSSSSSGSSSSSSSSSSPKESSSSSVSSSSSPKKDDQQTFYSSPKKDYDKEKDKEKQIQDPQQQIVDNKFDNIDKMVKEAKKPKTKKKPQQIRKELLTTTLDKFTVEMDEVLKESEKRTKDKQTMAKKKLITKSKQMLDLVLAGNRLADYIKDIKAPADYQAFNTFYEKFNELVQEEGIGTEEDKKSLDKKKVDFETKFEKDFVKPIEKRYTTISQLLNELATTPAATAITTKELKDLAMVEKNPAFVTSTKAGRKAIADFYKGKLTELHVKLETLKDFAWTPNTEDHRNKLKDKFDEIDKAPTGIKASIDNIPGL